MLENPFKKEKNDVLHVNGSFFPVFSFFHLMKNQPKICIEKK